MASKYCASEKKRRSFTGVANQVISLRQALELDRKPLLAAIISKNQQKQKDGTQKSETGEDKQPKYIKVSTEFQVLHPLRKETEKKEDRKRAQTAFVTRRNPEYDSDIDTKYAFGKTFLCHQRKNADEGKGKPKPKDKSKEGGKDVESGGSPSPSSSEDEDRKKMEPEEAVQSFKLNQWRATYLGMLHSAYAEMEWRYLVSKIPEHEIGIEVAAILFPFLFLLCVWDTIATSTLDLVQMTQIPLFGLFMVVYALGYPLMLYGYIIRHCYGLYGRTRRSRLAFAGIVLYPLLFIYFCVMDIVYQYSRNEGGIYYHLFTRGSDNHPDDYDPNFDYATKEYRSQYALGHYTFYDVSPSDLNSRVEEEKVPVRALSAEDRLKIMTMT